MVQTALIAGAHEQLGATLEIDSVRVGWGSAALHGVRFYQDTHVGTLELIAPEVSVELEMLPLLGGRAEVHSVAMRSPFVRLTLENEPNAANAREASGHVLDTVAVVDGMGELVVPNGQAPIVVPFEGLVYAGRDVQADSLVGLFRTSTLSATLAGGGHVALVTSEFPRSFQVTRLPRPVVDSLFESAAMPLAKTVSLAINDLDGDLTLKLESGESQRIRVTEIAVVDDRDLRTAMDSVWMAIARGD